jgi:hypothetical protein
MLPEGAGAPVKTGDGSPGGEVKSVPALGELEAKVVAVRARRVTIPNLRELAGSTMRDLPVN